MIHIILLILKIIGILLLSLLALLLLALLCLLAVPVRYRAQGEKQGDRLWGRAEISWLFRLFRFRAEYTDGSFVHEFYLFGMRWSRLAKRLRAIRRKKAAGKGRRERKEQQSDGEDQTAYSGPSACGGGEEAAGESGPKTDERNTGDTGEPAQTPDEPVAAEEPQEAAMQNFKGRAAAMVKQAVQALRRLKERIRSLAALPRKICFTIRNICAKIKKWRTLLHSKAFRYLKDTAIDSGKRMLRHVRPRRIRGSICFGFDDPARTGEALGILGLFYPVLPRKLTVVPDFTEQTLEGWLKVSGRIYGGFVTYQILRVLLDGKTIPAIKRLKKEA